MNILLHLLSDPYPNVVDNTTLVDEVDALAVAQGIKTEQEWWDIAVKQYPMETSAVMNHMRTCEDEATKS